MSASDKPSSIAEVDESDGRASINSIAEVAIEPTHNTAVAPAETPASTSTSQQPQLQAPPEPPFDGPPPTTSQIDQSLLDPLPLLSLPASKLQPFLDEFQKLQQALQKSHDSELRFHSKVQTYQQQQKVIDHQSTALQHLYTTDEKQYQLVQLQLVENTSRLDTIHQEITSKKDQITTLRTELQSIELQHQSAADGQRNEQLGVLTNLEQECTRYESQIIKEQKNLTSLRLQNIDSTNSYQEYQHILTKNQQQLYELEAQILDIQHQTAKEYQGKQILENQIHELQQSITVNQQTLQSKHVMDEKSESELQTLVQSIKHIESSISTYEHELYDLQKAIEVQQLQLQKQQSENALYGNNVKKQLKLLEDEQTKIQNQKQTLRQRQEMISVLNSKIETIEVEVQSTLQQKLQSQQRVTSLDTTITTVQHQYNTLTKNIETLVRERLTLAGKYEKTLNDIQQYEHLQKILQNQCLMLRHEIQSYKHQLHTHQQQYTTLQTERSTLQSTLHNHQSEHAKLQHLLAERKLQVHEYQLQYNKNQLQSEEEVQIYNTLNDSKNNVRKELLELKSQIHQYRLQFNYSAHTIKNYKSEIQSKNHRILCENYNNTQLQESITTLLVTNTNFITQKQMLEKNISQQVEELKNYEVVVNGLDSEYHTAYKMYSQLTTEHQLLNNQLIQRNQQLMTLYEQSKLTETLLQQSATIYNTRQSEYQTLTEEYQSLLKEMSIAEHDVERYNELKQKITTMNQSLQAEQLKQRVLQDELSKPMNIHRWRSMMDVDGEVYALIQQVRQLQVQINKEHSAIEQKQHLIDQKESLYIQIRKILSRKPGQEVYLQIEEYQNELKNKRRIAKRMNNELMLFVNATNDREYTVRKLKEELQLLKYKYFEMRKLQERQQRQASHVFHSSTTAPLPYQPLLDLHSTTEEKTLDNNSERYFTDTSTTMRSTLKPIDTLKGSAKNIINQSDGYSLDLNSLASYNTQTSAYTLPKISSTLTRTQLQKGLNGSEGQQERYTKANEAAVG